MTNLLSTSIRGLARGVPCFAAVLACSRHTPNQPAFRVLARGVEMSSCRVDHDWLYGQTGGVIVRVSRRTGKIEQLASASGSASLVAADGALFFLDRTGVHVWQDGAATDVRSFGSGHASSTLVRFRDMVCWGGDSPQDEEGVTAWPIDCAPVKGAHSATTWMVRPGVRSPVLAADSTKLYAGFVREDKHCEITDATDSELPLGVIPLPWECSASFFVTSDGPIMMEDIDTAWSFDPGVRQFSLPHPGGSPTPIGRRLYVRGSEGPALVDVRTGSASLVAKVALGSADSAMCGDARALYVEAADGSIVEVPLNSDQGG